MYQRDNFAPARKCPRCVQSLRRSELAPKEFIPRYQRDFFAFAECEIQIEVFEFCARGGVYQATRKQISSLHSSLFLPSQRSENKTELLLFKNPPSNPLSNLLIYLEANSQICCFHSFHPWIQFPRIPDYPGGRGRYEFLKFKFEFEI